jgi:hypothetical protein
VSSKRIVGAVVAAALTLLASAPSRARIPAVPSDICNANGSVALAVNGRTGVATWTLKGGGQCATPNDDVDALTCTDRGGNPCAIVGNPPAFTFSASGTSTSAGGLCSGVLVQNLTLKATLSVPAFGSDPFDGLGFWYSKAVEQRWSAGKTLFPGLTPFRIFGGDGLSSGAGLIVDRSGACLSHTGLSSVHFTLAFAG